MTQPEMHLFQLPQKGIINLTKTQVNLPSGQYIRSGKHIAHLNFNWEPCEDVEDFATAKMTDIEVVGLPEPVEGTWYLVSKSVFNHCKERLDLLYTPLIRSCAEATNLVVAERLFRR